MKKILLTLLIALLAFSSTQAQNCQAGYVYSNSPGSLVVNFYDSSYVFNGTISNYAWNFGDNSFGTGANPIHTYNSMGAYGVILTITSDSGCTSTFYDTVWVGTQPCFLYATMNYSALVQTLTVQPAGGNAPYTFAWSPNLGSGQSIQAFAPGVYCCTVTDANGCVVQSCFNVTSASTCQASFTSATTLGSSVGTFTNTSTTSAGTITSYFWNFGDSTTSTLSNTTHTFPTTGIYFVSLTINTSTGCSSTQIDTVYVGVQPCNLYAIASYSNATSTLDLQTFGGTAPYTYLWSPSAGLSSPIIPNPTVTVSSITTFCALVTDALGCTYQTCIVVYPSYSDTICGTVFNDVNGNGVQDSAEYNGYGYVSVYGPSGQFSAYVDSITGQYSVAVPPGVYSIWFCTFGQFVSFSIPSADTSGCAYYDSVVVSGGGMHCGYNFGLQYNQGFIEGDVFIDSNNNGVFDTNEAGVPYQSIHAGNYWGYTNSNGHYSITVVPGTYTVSFSPAGIYAGYTISTSANYAVTVANGASSTGINFGIYVIPGSTNLSVGIIPHTTVTPGFPAWYNIYVNNVGANATGATLTMHYDASLSFLNSTPTQTSINAGTQTITWNIPTIQPGASRSVYVRFTASTSIAIGASTFEFVDVVATNGIDVNLNNNFDSVHQVVTGSWDPNNKLVVSSNYSNPTYQVISSVNPNQSIDYTINFQNTGTGPAVNISVLDDLSPDLDANSFVLLGTSHNATVSRSANHVSYVFPNIMLADSNSNEPASHGFINFRINANPGLGSGHTILDKADIYFDFNAPVATNDADLLLINPLGIADIRTAANEYVSPNPAHDVVRLNYTLNKTTDVMITLRTIQGKVLETMNLKNQASGKNVASFDIRNLAEGIYMLELNDGSSVKTIKVVKTK